MSTEDAKRLLITALGRQSSFWGMGKITGELYAILYLSRDPVTLADLAKTLGVTKGNVSIAIRRLEDLGMVRRQQNPGDRRVFFVPNSNFWDIARHFLSRRHQPEFAASFELIEQSLAVSDPASSGEQDVDRFVYERIRTLKTFYGVLDRLTAALLAINSDELVHLADMMGHVMDGGEGNPSVKERKPHDQS